MQQIEAQPLNEFYQSLERITVKPFWRGRGGRSRPPWEMAVIATSIEFQGNHTLGRYFLGKNQSFVYLDTKIP